MTGKRATAPTGVRTYYAQCKECVNERPGITLKLAAPLEAVWSVQCEGHGCQMEVREVESSA